MKNSYFILNLFFSLLRRTEELFVLLILKVTLILYLLRDVLIYPNTLLNNLLKGVQRKGRLLEQSCCFFQ